MIRGVVLCAVALSLHGCGEHLPIARHRIISDNPCVDAILYAVAQPEQIGAISTYSKDTRATSVPLAWARRFPTIGGTAEEIIAARPSLYLTGSAAPATREAAHQAGIAMMRVAVANSVADSEAQIRTVAKAIGRIAAGEAFIAHIEASLSQNTQMIPLKARPTALIYQGGGLILGQGTLADDLLTRAGFRNAARIYGARAWDVQPLERIIMYPPDVILAPHTATGEEARGLRQLRTALNDKIRVADFDAQLLYCGAGSITRASNRLHAIRSQ